MNFSIPTPENAWLKIAIGVALFVVAVIGVVIGVTYGVGAGKFSLAAALASLPAALGIRFAFGGLTQLLGYRWYVAIRYLLVPHPKVTRLTKVLLIVAIVVRVVWMIVTGEGMGETILALAGRPSDALAVGTALTSSAVVAIVLVGVLRHSRPAFWCFVLGIAIAMLAQLLLVLGRGSPWLMAKDYSRDVIMGLGITFLVGVVFAGLAVFFGCLRAFFTFFTTVPIGGVWIGTAALVVVLAVMSGFESDLREKILGSNAHIQITKEKGEFVDWREAKAKIDKLPGIVASTPYATSEVVIAAHNNGMNVIIKGIDPATVGAVTDLVDDLEDPEAMKRLLPLATDDRDLTVKPTAPSPDKIVDPAPADLPAVGEPIDFSAGDRPPLPPDGGGAMQLEPPVKVEIVDPPPDDLAALDGDPEDFSAPRDDAEPDIEVIDSIDRRIDVDDFGPDSSTSRRTQLLHGVLVGRELVKQTHLYTGEEVRIVSPLSDPSNPDATGTPIPFNRDYRVAGIFFTGMYEYDLKYIYVTLDSLQDFLDRGDAIDGIEVRLANADDTGIYIPTDTGPGLIRAVLGPGYRVADWRELNRSLFSALQLEKIMMFLVLGIVILVASFSIVGNLIMVVVEKGRQIALLKTLGGTDGGVTVLFAIQGLMIGVIGTVLGVTTGLITCWVGKTYGLPLDPDVYYIDKVPIHVEWQSVLAAGAAGILISIAATIYPAWLASRVRPAVGMRH